MMWDIATRSISLYDPVDEAVFIRYKDTTEPPENREGFTVTNSDAYHMFIRSADKMVYRFHSCKQSFGNREIGISNEQRIRTHVYVFFFFFLFRFLPAHDRCGRNFNESHISV